MSWASARAQSARQLVLCPRRALERWESTYHLMVVAVGDVCFLEKSTESSLQIK